MGIQRFLPLNNLIPSKEGHGVPSLWSDKLRDNYKFLQLVLQARWRVIFLVSDPGLTTSTLFFL